MVMPGIKKDGKNDLSSSAVRKSLEGWEKALWKITASQSGLQIHQVL